MFMAMLLPNLIVVIADGGLCAHQRIDAFVTLSVASRRRFRHPC